MMPILAYHKIDDRFELGLTNVKPRTFFAQVDGLTAEGFAIVDAPQNAVTSPKSVCLTFDDAYDCFYRNVLPYLAARKMKAIVFVISDFVGRKNEWDLRLAYRPFMHMSAAQLTEASDFGIEIGSHSCTHRDVTRLEDAELKRELSESKSRIEDLVGRQVRYFSFPYGRHNRETVAAAHDAGYTGLFGLGSRVDNGVYARIPVYRIDGVAAAKRKASSNRVEIIKSDFIHSFANISALASTLRAGRKVAN